MRKVVLILVAVFTLMLCEKAFAQETVWDMAKSDQYGKKVGGMLGRGLLNVSTCFVDLIVQTVHGTQDGPPFMGTLTGLGGGIGCTALRVSSGALDVVTFWVPGFNGIPVSKSYSNCLEEEEAPAQAAPEAGAPPISSFEPAPAAPKHHKHNPMEYVKK